MKALLRFVAPLLLAVVAMPSVALPAQAGNQQPNLCPEVWGSVQNQVAPTGFVAVVDSYLTSKCTLTSSSRLLPRSEFLASLGQAKPLITLGKATLLAGDPTITTHQRLWDLGGINLLNEYDTTLTWSYDGSQVFNISGYSSYYAKREPPPDVGWWLNGHNEYYINGCWGCTYIELAGYGDFKYDGLFDHTGRFENEYWNYDTGYKNGTHGYLMRWHWKNGFFGWHMQTWCC